MTNDTDADNAPWANWTTTSRIPGLLYVVAGLLVLSVAASGAAAPASSIYLDTPLVAGHDETAPAATTEPPTSQDAPGATDHTNPHTSDAAPGTTTFTSPFKTGDRLSPEQVAWFHAHAAAMRAADTTYSGPGAITAWEPSDA